MNCSEARALGLTSLLENPGSDDDFLSPVTDCYAPVREMKERLKLDD